MSFSRSSKEAIRLYRDILKATRRFTWANDKGEQWSTLLRENARKEFDESKHEKDPLIIARMLTVGRQCLHETEYKMDVAEQRIIDKVENTRNRDKFDGK